MILMLIFVAITIIGYIMAAKSKSDSLIETIGFMFLIIGFLTAGTAFSCWVLVQITKPSTSIENHLTYESLNYQVNERKDLTAECIDLANRVNEWNVRYEKYMYWADKKLVSDFFPKDVYEGCAAIELKNKEED